MLWLLVCLLFSEDFVGWFTWRNKIITNEYTRGYCSKNYKEIFYISKSSSFSAVLCPSIYMYVHQKRKKRILYFNTKWKWEAYTIYTYIYPRCIPLPISIPTCQLLNHIWSSSPGSGLFLYISEIMKHFWPVSYSIITPCNYLQNICVKWNTKHRKQVKL